MAAGGQEEDEGSDADEVHRAAVHEQAEYVRLHKKLL